MNDAILVVNAGSTRRVLVASIVIGPFMLIGTLPAVAGQSSSSGTQIQMAAGSNSTADRDTYTQKAQGDMQEWQQKLHAFSEKAKAKGEKAGNAAENELNTAWSKTEAEAHKLQTAGADDWESAKASYERATRELADAWDRNRPHGK